MKRIILYWVVHLAYWLGIDAFFYLLNRRAKRIVTFHNVMPAALLAPEDESLICFSDEKFARIVDEIGKRYSFSNDVDEAKTCTLTFDDGYLNQLEVAGRILCAKGVPAILFLARELVDADRPLVVDQCVTWADKVPMDVAEKGFGQTFVNRVELWQSAVRPLFAADGANRGRAALETLNGIWPMEKALSSWPEEYRRLRFTGVTSGLVEEFRQAGWIFGHHTCSHFPVKNLPENAACSEMTPPEGMQDVVFSFPYGDGGSVSARDVALAKELGYPCAVSNEVELTPLVGRYFRPRFMITTDDKYAIHFLLSGLKYFLKYRRLLPKCAF